MTVRRPASRRELAWLDEQLPVWVAGGLVSDGSAIRDRYVEARSFGLARLLLYLGSSFVGVGLIWLVASNLDQLSPLLRLLTVTLLWLGVTAIGEVLAERRAHRDGASPVLGAVRGLAALGFGAVVFQAAQSLQVPAYESGLLAAWGLGALLYAYATGGVMPLVIGVSVGAGWFVWHSVELADGVIGFVFAVLIGGVIAAALTVLHDARWRPAFAETWRAAAALLVLTGLFVAALPWFDAESFTWNTTTIAGLSVAVVLGAAALWFARAAGRVEVAVPLVALPVAIGLVLWNPPLPDDAVGGEAWVSALVSVAVYVTAAGALALVGSLRGSPVLVGVATAALVVFTTVQGFAVFASIWSGAILFLLLGGVFLATGYVFDRARRRLAGSLKGALS